MAVTAGKVVILSKEPKVKTSVAEAPETPPRVEAEEPRVAERSDKKSLIVNKTSTFYRDMIDG